MRGHRQQILISGDADWCRLRAAQLLEDRPALWVSDAVLASTLLGTETQWLVYDGHDGFDPNAFGAVSGLVCGGGALLLLMPAADIKLTGSRFLKRFYQCLDSDQHWVRNPQQLAVNVVPPRPSAISLTDDQQFAVDAVCRVANGHRRRPAVLIADRGRGKSSALGIAAAKLLKEGHQNILVTAPRRNAVAALFNHAESELNDIAGKIRYVAPDELLRVPHQADLLLVDEAAGIPVSMLQKMLNQYSRIAFATTVHGYEGAGQGFAIRFKEILDQHCRQWRQIRLQTPIRWAEDDPLERFVFNALLLDAEPTQISVEQKTEFKIEAVDRDALLQDEQQLRDIFGLLISAHYRTTPRDLLELLDGPGMGIFIASNEDGVVGVLLYANEGGIDAELALAISQGKRRLKGNLVPQVLAAQLGFAVAAEQKTLRVVRIAVHAALRRQGIASRLLDALRQYAGKQKIDMLGTSFGATAGLLKFWKKSGFESVRLGMRREASSGSHAVLMLQSISDAGTSLQRQVVMRFRDNFLLQLAGPLRDVESALVAALLEDLNFTDNDLSVDVVDQLKAFAAGQRGYEDCLGALQQFLLLNLQSGIGEEHDLATGALLQKILQGRGWAHVATYMQVTGKAEVIKILKATVHQQLQET